MAFVTGKNRVPSPATGMTAFLTGFVVDTLLTLYDVTGTGVGSDRFATRLGPWRVQRNARRACAPKSGGAVVR